MAIILLMAVITCSTWQHLLIKEAEKLLIYYCSPPYNSSLVYDMNQSEEFKNENVMVINCWQKHRLPYEVSTLWYNSDCWKSRRRLLRLEKEGAGNRSAESKSCKLL